MKRPSQFRFSGWAAGSLFGLVAANFLLVFLVAGADVFLGQPPQLMVPLFALLFASGAWMLNRRRSGRVKKYATKMAGDAETITSPGSQRSRQRQSNTPAYLAMIIIRRPFVIASTQGNDTWKGAIQ